MIKSINSERIFKDPKEIIFPTPGKVVYLVTPGAADREFVVVRCFPNTYFLMRKGAHSYCSATIPLWEHKTDIIPDLQAYCKVEGYTAIRVNGKTILCD